MKSNLVDLSRGCAKGLLIILNVLCMLLAILIFASAVVDCRILKQYGEDHGIGTLTGDVIIIVISVMLIAVALLGCFGASLEKVKLLYLYSGLLIVLVVLEILVGIFVAVQRCGLQIRVTDWLRTDFFTNGTAGEEDLHRKVWDEIQISYECCGLNGPEDYQAIQQSISLSCCPRAYRARTASAQHQLYRACIESTSYYNAGCEDEILSTLESDAGWLLGNATISFLLEAAGIVLAMWFGNSLKNSVNVYEKTVKY